MAMRRVIVGGRVLNRRTAAMLKRAERRLGYDLIISQGSYNAGRVAASGGTHDGGGAVDISVSNLKNPNTVVLTLREVGFAAWLRKASQGPWPEHIHAIAIGDPELSSGARFQVAEYYDGRNGLVNRAADDGPRLGKIPVWPIKLPTVFYLVIKNQLKTDKVKPRASVRVFQKALSRKSGRYLSVDGIAGPQTRNALRRYNVSKGRPANAEVTIKIVREICAGFARVV